MTLQDVSWRPVYESGFGRDETLMDAFYRPFLGEVVRYDRLAGYLSLRSLANALEGVDSLLETEGQVRVIAGADLQERERGALFPDSDDPLSPWVESQLAIIGTLLDQGDLEIRVGDPAPGGGIFHPKLGIGVDDAEEPNTLSFEGSVNETLTAWQHNYERFKVHRSWMDGERKYVEEDVDTFQRLWEDAHPSVDVYELDEADQQDIIEWTETDRDLDQHVERVRKHSPEATISEGAAGKVASVAGRTPGGLHLAEEVSTLDQIWPHQRTISDTAVSIYPNNLLFCDEVGLGKTIEIGLTLSRLIHTGTVENALLLVPAGLVQQWQDELLNRFNLHAYYFDHAYNGDYLVGPFGGPLDDRISLDGWREDDTWENTPIGGYVSDQDGPSIIIQSWHTARREANQSHVAPDSAEPVWDLTVVDEAHSARENTQLYDLLGKVESVSECLYALTATPMQLNVGELYDLLRLVDLPESWDDKERFTEFFETRRALDTSLDKVGRDHNSVRTGQQEVLKAVRGELELDDDEKGKQLAQSRIERFAELLHDHIQEIPGYDEQAAAVIDEHDSLGLKQRKSLEKLLGVRDTSSRFDNPTRLMFDCGPTAWGALVEASEWATPVQSRIFRNTRSVLEQCKELGLLKDTVPKRSVETKRIDLGEAKPLYDRVEEYIDDTYEASQKALTGKEKLALGFVMTTYRQRLTSSLYAIKESLRRRIDKLDEEVEDMTEEVSRLSEDTGVTEATIDEVVGQASLDAYRPTGNISIVERELEELHDFIDELDRAHTDPKIVHLRSDIKSLRQEARDNIVIFTQYQDTLDHIRHTLTDTHPNVGTYSGSGARRYDAATDSWESVGKETIKQDFTSHGGTNILVCTDSASEGLNLQTADALINYDLPWNPMRVEQRIGRIDRIGQENPVVKIINYAYEDSVDGDIYEELENRLDLFEDVVGPMRPVLNSIESDIKTAVMDRRDERTSQQVAEEAEERAAAAQAQAEEVGLDEEDEQEVTRASVIRDAGLVGWGDRHHPALVGIGQRDRAYGPTATLELMETLLTQSQQLASAGWEFVALRNHERADDYPGTARGAYVLDSPEGTTIETPERAAATAQTDLRESGEAIVTFDPAVVEEFPSIRLLLPGDPLFDELVSLTTQHSEQEVVYVCGTVHDDGTTEVTVDPDDRTMRTAAVVLPAVRDDGRESLPDGESLVTVHEARQVVNEWLSGDAIRRHSPAPSQS
jgi:SNF2 family DNA or RNA helicase